MWRINSDYCVTRIENMEYCLGPPSAPTGPLNIVGVTKGGVTLSWKPAENDGGSPLTGYVLERRQSTQIIWTKVAKIFPNMLTYEVTGLKEDADYYFRVSAKNKHGVGPALESGYWARPTSKFGE